MSNRLEAAASEAKAAAGSLTDHGQKAISDIAAMAERTIAEADENGRARVARRPRHSAVSGQDLRR